MMKKEAIIRHGFKIPCCVLTTGRLLAVHLFHPDLRDGVQHLLVKASSRIITAYLVTVLPPAASMHKSRVSHGYSNAKTFMSETQIIITVPKTQHKVLSKVSTMEC